MIRNFIFHCGLSNVNSVIRRVMPSKSGLVSLIDQRFISSVISKSVSDVPIIQSRVPTNSSIYQQSVRTLIRNHYRPNPAKRIKKHGIHKRMATEGGLAVLWRRFLKGRHNLAVYEDFRPLLKQFQKPPRKIKW